MIVIATHAVFLKGKDIYGPPHAISSYLNKQKKDHIFIKHPLDSKGETFIETYKNGKLEKTQKKRFNTAFPSIFRYLQEMIITTKYIYSVKNKCEVFIGVDPLNAIVGVVLRKIGKAKHNVYFCADFALKRFDNPLLNNIYHQLDNIAMFNSDLTWSISKRITSYRRKRGLKNSKNLLLPNAPFFHEIHRLPINKIDRFHLVIVARLSEGIAYTLLIDAVERLRKQFSGIRLSMIGGGPLEKELKEYVKQKKMEKNVEFLGPKSHDDMFNILTHAGVGIALYNFSDPDHYHYFSDSMKVRDYLASGLPTVISGNSAIIDELEKNEAGVMTTLELEDVVMKMKSILGNEKRFTKMRNNAIALAEQYDTYTLISRYFTLLKK